LARLLAKHLDPATTFWTALENKPSSRLNGVLQKKRGVRSGLPDTMVIFRQHPIFIEVKSRAGIASKVQKRVRDELLTAGCQWVLINEDRLGLDRVYVQAKRYAKGNAVGRPEVQAFVGSLVGLGATKGVFVITSTFGPQARDFVRHLPQRVILLDGRNLADLMIGNMGSESAPAGQSSSNVWMRISSPRTTNTDRRSGDCS
jgi:Restriction endonuclease